MMSLTVIYYRHLVHIEDLHSNEKNFISSQLQNDPIVKSIENVIQKNIDAAIGMCSLFNRIAFSLMWHALWLSLQCYLR